MSGKNIGIIVVAIIIIILGWWFLRSDESANVPTDETSNITSDESATDDGATDNAARDDATDDDVTTDDVASSIDVAGSANTNDTDVEPAAPAIRTAETKAVAIKSFAFGSGNLSVKVGDTVTWTNNDSAPHTVTSTSGGVPNGTFESGNLNSGQTFSFTFTSAGTFNYQCKYHPSMKGTVTVTQ